MTESPFKIFDPVNPANNVAQVYSAAGRDIIVDAAEEALDAIAFARRANTKGDAVTYWQEILGTGWKGAWMSYAGTQTQAFTITTARYVTSKIAADLDVLRSHYQLPSQADVTAYAEEAAQLLAKRYLGTVEFGFKRNGTVVFALKYETRADGSLADDRPGKVTANLDLSGTTFVLVAHLFRQVGRIGCGKTSGVQERSAGATHGRPVADDGEWLLGRREELFIQRRGRRSTGLQVTMSESIFEASLEFPDPNASRRLASLVGIDDQKARLEKGLRLMLDKNSIERWSEKHHEKKLPIVSYFQSRPPLFILAGDVGTGKTALAENIGDAVARSEKLDVTLHRLSLAARGTGMVGEMTKLVSAAFNQVGDFAQEGEVS